MRFSSYFSLMTAVKHLSSVSQIPQFCLANPSEVSRFHLSSVSQIPQKCLVENAGPGAMEPRLKAVLRQN